MIKKTIIIITVAFLVAFIAYSIIDETLPIGEEGPRAEWLTDQMFEMLNKSAWDSLDQVSWSYPPGHHFVWDKNKNEVEVKWDDFKAIIQPDKRTGEVWQNGILVEEESEILVKTAISYFFNDSFWLVAPFKARDPGTIRKVVQYQGQEALLVQYTTGGDTPGDSYLWIFDNDFRPMAWKFWVQAIPLGGMEFTWEEWQNVDGAQISTLHKGIIDLEIKNLK